MPNDTATPDPIERLRWLEPVAVQIAGEASLVCDEDIVNLVVFAFDGVVSSPATGGEITRELLLERARSELALWLREAS
jgi:hypothetical protein